MNNETRPAAATERQRRRRAQLRDEERENIKKRTWKEICRDEHN